LTAGELPPANERQIMHPLLFSLVLASGMGLAHLGGAFIVILTFLAVLRSRG
jgi:hypothetical protein